MTGTPPRAGGLSLHNVLLGGRVQAVGLTLHSDPPMPGVLAELRFLLERCGFSSLAEAADALLAYVLAPATGDVPREPPGSAQLTLATGGEEVRVERTRTAMRYVQEQKDFGAVDVIHEGKSAGIYRLRIRPGGTIPTHQHLSMEEHELVLGEGLHLQRKPVERGTALAWPRRFPHRYDNPSSTEQTVLCVDRPRFNPDDEVEVDVPDALLHWPPMHRFSTEGAE